MPEATAVPANQPGNWVDPYRAYTFNLEIKGVSAGHFTEVSGLGARIERITYREAGLNSVVRSIPGQVSYSAVTLRYGLTQSPHAWNWLMEAIGGNARRTEVSILVLDPAGSAEVMRWNLANAWPCEWIGAPLAGTSTDLAIETLTVAHEGIERVGGEGSGGSAASGG